MPSLKQGIQLVQNMGARYVGFRVMHELKKRTGTFQRKFPQKPPFQQFITLEEWKKQPVNFFFEGKQQVKKEEATFAALQKEFRELKEGTLSFFSSTKYPLGKKYDWLSNPDTGYRYDSTTHWSQVNDYSMEAGDIKYVWEKSRFSFLYTIIRYDAHTGNDHAEWVWNEIRSWIVANPINCGPNYKCSQEISLRVLNWTFALHYYKDSSSLSEEIFQEIIFSIYWQLHHVYHNINFSRIAVRNNHAITETLALYLGGLLYPFFPNATEWKKKGKKWFEEEISYQIYPDGTFLQFSMNYHRVVVQLLSWGIRLAELNGERFQEVVYERAKKSLHFLTACMDRESGWLPNYGANDGALFFRLNNKHYRDYRPQLEALARTLNLNWQWGQHEDALWYGVSGETFNGKKSRLCHSERSEESFQVEEGAKPKKEKEPRLSPDSLRGISSFEAGGYYLCRQEESFSFIRCGNHKDRPSQADNLHLDIWYKGVNILHDAGSFKYNTDDKELRFFMGTASHNTVMLDGYDQMQKGARFIWYDWTQREEARWEEHEEFYLFSGNIKAFQYLDKKIRHSRTVKIYKKQPLWEVEDSILNKPTGMHMKQLWHTQYPELLTFKASVNNQEIKPTIQQGWYSGFYGKKESCSEIVFSSQENVIKTFISVKE